MQHASSEVVLSYLFGEELNSQDLLEKKNHKTCHQSCIEPETPLVVDLHPLISTIKSNRDRTGSSPLK